MTLLTEVVEVSVPATSANLGPGFDALGLALDRRDRVRVQVAEELRIDVSGVGERQVPRDARHLVHRALVATLEHLEQPVPPVHLSCDNAIPHGRGMGSSSAAIVAGVVAGRALVAGGSLVMDDAAVLDLAATLEGHADNVAPALLGGFTVAWHDGDRYAATRLPVDPRVGAVVLVPDTEVATTTARALLPPSVPHAEAAATAGRAALLVAALGGRPELLMAATADWLHQEYRRDAMPATLELVDALRGAGVPAVVSGAGPSVLALVDGDAGPTGTASVVADLVPSGWEAWTLPVDHGGARVAGRTPAP